MRLPQSAPPLSGCTTSLRAAQARQARARGTALAFLVLSAAFGGGLKAEDEGPEQLQSHPRCRILFLSSAPPFGELKFPIA